LKFHEAQIPQALELLADFVVDMEVAGMQARQLGTAGINVRKREIFPAELVATVNRYLIDRGLSPAKNPRSEKH
jgi:hypothetical protein